jgi:hypothetical protein
MVSNLFIIFAQRTGRPGSLGVSRERRSFISRIAASDGLSAGRLKEPAMNCSKCASLMASESSAHHHSTDYSVDLGDVQTMHSCAYRCMTCGNFVDPTILANRAKQADERRLLEQANTIATWASVHVAA